MKPDPVQLTPCLTRKLIPGLLVIGLLLTPADAATRVSLRDGRWHLNDKVTAPGSPAEGQLTNVRMVYAVFEDRNRNDFDASANTDEFIRRIPDYMSQGVIAFTIGLQGGMPDYEGALNSAFEPDGALRPEYLKRVERVIKACDEQGAAVILSCFYQRQDQVLEDEEAVRTATVNVARWLTKNRFSNVVIEITNEYGHGGFQHNLLRQDQGQVELLNLCRANAPGFLISTSSTRNGWSAENVAAACDFLTIHLNNVPTTSFGEQFRKLRRFGKPIICNEDDKVGMAGAVAAETCVGLDVSWGLMLRSHNQAYPFHFDGVADDPVIYATLKRLTTPTPPAFSSNDYFPPPDSRGGWRKLADHAARQEKAGIDAEALDQTFDYLKSSTKNGGLLVVHRGWLAYERYFGLAGPESAPNLASCAKSFTSVCTGILLKDRPELFPKGLDQKIFTPAYLPAAAFPLSDERKKDITLGRLLSFSAGIRGNNPCLVNRRPVTVDAPGPDGAHAMRDDVALGRADAPQSGGRSLSTATLWCNPGEGYSYSTASISIAAIMLRHITGRELQDDVQEHLAAPLGWQHWGWGYRNVKELNHTPGGGGIAVRPTDMLRFGYLLLRQGRWQDRQLIPADYVQAATRKSAHNPHAAYSLQFDVNTEGDIPDLPRDAFWKTGSGGHALYVVPSLDLVVWKLGGRDSQYSEKDTGLTQANPATSDPRTGWKESVDARTAAIETLRRVVNAVR